ncbi:MAG: discoidin domain-containing protein [Archangium sp.]|nr:discoidin domain-containing protein [Archangium sp.]MDP3152868.1 discoidin domain-containing protein [Archangium sp.]MDP3573062.1 discoidin domain-containing protein [Archangium sp.]
MTFALLLALALAADDGGASTTRPNLLRTAKVTRSDGAPNVARMADGVASTDGDVWDSPRAALLAATGVVEWDLGAVERVSALRIQADNNDRYIISGSLDGARWTPIWVAQSVELPGVQTRTSPELTAETRFLRLTAEGGDSMYSVAELELFDSQAALLGAQLERIAPPPPPPPAPAPPFDTGFLIVFGVTGVIFGYFRWVIARNRRAAMEAQKLSSDLPLLAQRGEGRGEGP